MQFSTSVIFATLLATTPLLTFALPADGIEAREAPANEHIWERNILEGRVAPGRGKRPANAPKKNHHVPCPNKACLNDQRCVDLGCQYCDSTTNYCVE